MKSNIHLFQNFSSVKTVFSENYFHFQRKFRKKNAGTTHSEETDSPDFTEKR